VTYSRSSSYRPSPHPSRRRSILGTVVRAFALLIIVAGALVTGIALGRGESPIDWIRDDGSAVIEPLAALIPERSDSSNSPSNPDSALPNTSDTAPGQLSDSPPSQSDVLDEASDPMVAQNSAPPESNTDDLALVQDATEEVDAPDDILPEEESAADEESGQPDVEQFASAEEVAARYIEHWTAGDFDAMYDVISTDAQAEIERQAFIDRYTGIMEEAGIVTLQVTTAGSESDTVAIDVEMESSLVGRIAQQNTITAIEEDAGWRVAWTPSLIFAGLDDGCVQFFSSSTGRGSILDRDGEPLAQDGIVNTVGIVPGQLENETQTVAVLARLLDMKTSDIRDRYEEGNPEWFWPITDLPDPLDTDTLNAISNMSGVAVREKAARIYPYGEIAAHITGYVTSVNAEDLENDETGTLVAGQMIGRAGIEAAANDVLAGKPGGTLSIVSCATRIEQEVIAERPPVPPQDLVLSLDIDFQTIVHDALGDAAGSAVVIDPQTGGVMALVSHPTFDPNLFVRGLTEKEAQTVFDEKTRPLINRATQQGYPTGSIFKIITMAAAMANLGYEGGSEIYCPTDWNIPNTDQVWRDWTYEYGTGDQGWLNLHTALVNSCNTVFYQLGYELDEKDNELLPEMTKAFGLGAPTGIPYLQEIAGTVPSPEWKLSTIDDYWATGDAVNLSIGQGFLEATPLQMANAYAAIANGGNLLQPFIVEGIRDMDGKMTIVGERAVIRELPLDDAVIAEIQSALRDQTSNSWGAGSVSVFGDFTWPIAGKTGTAQNQINRAEKPHSWFAAFGPYGDEAEITSIVMVESSGEGVSFAAPRTRDIYLAWLSG
jgi:penicillin-binding protein 2